MDFWIVVIVLVSIMAGSSAITAIVNAIKPKIKAKDLEELKSEIKRDLLLDGDIGALPGSQGISERVDKLQERMELQDAEIRQLSDENSFLRRLLEKEDPKAT